MAIELLNGSELYRVGKKVAETAEYRIYACEAVSGKRLCLLQIATSMEHNGGLDRAAYVLRELERKADELEAEYAAVKTDPDKFMNYNLAFPEIVDSFKCSEQGGRRVNILAFRDVENVSQMVPLSNLVIKNRCRMDLRSSAWVMGKSLKLLAFAHSEGISPQLLTSGNILIEPDKHYVVVFDWAYALTTTPRALPADIRRHDITEAAKAIIAALGGDPSAGTTPDEGDESCSGYIKYLLRLAQGRESDAVKAHKRFYEIVDSIWPKEYYPFTTIPL